MIGQLTQRLASTGPSGGPQVKRGTDILEGPYPKRFDDFIGQEIARAQILSAAKSSVRRGEPLDHMLLASGIPGIGKTTLGRLTASLLDVGFVELGGLVTDKDAIKALRVMEDGDVLFLDEVHRLVSGGKARAEWLLTLLQDGSIQTPAGAYLAPKITVIAATTDAQRLPETILDRFAIRPVLEEYSTPEATQIATGAAMRLGFGSGDLPMPVGGSWLEAVARASNNNPRRMTQLLTVVRDIAISTDLSNLTKEGYDITLALEWTGLTEDGLTQGAQNYLIALFAYGGIAGATTIKAVLAEEQVAHTEKLLLQKGLIVVTPRGRELTEFGSERAKDLAAEIVSAHRLREGIE